MPSDSVYYKLQYKAGDNWLTVATSDDYYKLLGHKTRLMGSTRINKVLRVWIKPW